MATVMFRVRERSRGKVSFPMMVWAVIVAVVLFMLEARYGSSNEVLWVGIIATALFGAYLGVRRRTGAAFIAPFVSWLVTWFPLIVASMIHNGFFKGLGVGILWITVGWFLIGLAEFAVLFVFAAFFRLLRGGAGPQSSTVIFGPQGDGHNF
jgi:hypothetical protein